MNKDINKKPKTKKIDAEQTSLDDEQRIKVLSPGLLVFKRFIRNRLAITGAVFIFAMFAFSFVGGWLMPYRESEIFTKYIDMSKPYAGISVNTEYKMITTDGTEFPLIARSQFILATNRDEIIFSAQDINYSQEKLSDELYMIYEMTPVATAANLGGSQKVEYIEENLGTIFEEAYIAALDNGETTFTVDDNEYIITNDKKSTTASVQIEKAIATKNIFDLKSADIAISFDFCLNAELAIAEIISDSKETTTFESEGVEYTINYANEKASVYITENDEEVLYANVSKYIVQPTYSDVFLSLEFKDKVKGLLLEDVEEFVFINENGEEEQYTLERDNDVWTVKWVEDTLVVLAYEAPSSTHLIGTDGNGMDLLTRLMYGGRISLMIGFIVVIIETFIGVVLGGIAGYFGKWIDNLIMRTVDVFNCIPALPIIIILGAMMDQLRVAPEVRMLYLMILLAILGWPMIARMVRGQILSLREQEFMIATEATGLSVSKRIFKHLVPNVIPQLIVICTLSLGGIILTESLLSFLGLGVKFPFASWGNIINAVSNVFVMTNYLFVWIPAGFCILITVLGFNFIGDGLRDAFDPKMKR